MSTGQTLNTISTQLQQLLRKINGRLLSTLASPESIAPHKSARDPLISDLNNWRQQLELMQRELKRIGGNLDSREQHAHRAPRSQRFRERQSVGSGRDSLEKAEKLAAKAQARLKQLTHRLLIPGDVEAINSSFELMTDAIKEAQDLRGLVQQASRNGTLSQQDANEICTVISVAKASYQNQTPQQAAAPDWLLLLTLFVRIGHMVALKAYQNAKS